MKKLLVTFGVCFLFLSCEKEKQEERLFAGYNQTIGVPELPTWLKTTWKIQNENNHGFIFIDEKRVKTEMLWALTKKEGVNVWTKRTEKSFEIISKIDDERMKDPLLVGGGYISEIFELIDEKTLRYSYININEKYECSYCERVWVYYTKQ